MRRSRSAGSTRKTFGAARDCRPSGGPTRTAPGSPTVRRRRRRRCWKGTPDHPGPAVAPGSPCSYAPPPELSPRPGNPMPCAGVDQGQGPFGPERAVPGTARRRIVAAEPERAATDAGDPDRRPARGAGTRSAGHTGAAAAEGAAGRAHRRLATGRSDSAAVDVRARAAARTAAATGPGPAAAGAVHHARRDGR